MAVAKIVRIRARAGRGQELDGALFKASVAFEGEAGTLVWRVISLSAEERAIFEVFDDDASASRHDSSGAVATLISDLDRLAETVEVEAWHSSAAANP